MTVLIRSLARLQVEVTAGVHKLIMDEPLGFGDDLGPDPYSVLLASLGACTAMTMRMYADRKGWPLEEVIISLDTYSIHAKDCEDCVSDPEASVSIIERQLDIRGPLSSEQIARLAEIADRCPIHRTLTSEIKIRTQILPNPNSGSQLPT